MLAIRTIKVGGVQSAISLQSNESAMESDNNADNTVVVSNCLTVHDFGRLVDVSG